VTGQHLVEGSERGWAEFPAPSRPDRWRPPASLVGSAACVALVALGPTARAVALRTGWWGVAVGVLGVAIGIAVASARSVRSPGPPRVALVVAALAAIAFAAGPFAATWALLGTVAAAGARALLARDGGAAGPFPRLGPVVGTSVGAAVLGLLHPTSPALLLAAAIPAAASWGAVAFPQVAVAVEAGLRRGVEAVGDGLRALAFALLAVPFVVLPWSIGRLVRWDTTWAPRAPGSRWVVAHGDSGPSARPWQPATPPATWPWARRATRAGLRLAVASALLVVAVGVVRDRASTPAPYLIEAPAMADSPFWPELTQAQEQLRANMGLGSYAYEQPDVASEHLNIVDGHRATWTPPQGASCAPLEIWTFGGSTMFGEGQRDDYTIASWLARTAWADGIPLEVINFGQLGDPLWIEVRRLEEALGTTSDQPDLVIFYDGANEVITRIALNEEGRAAEQTFVSYLDSGLFLQLDRFLRPVYRFMTESDALAVEEPLTARLDANQVAALAARQYRLALASGRRLVADEGLDAVWFNQATTWTTPLPAEQVAASDVRERFGRAVTAAYLQELPEGVVDLAEMFADAPEPVFYDTAHTNELGARRVAEAMWDEVGAGLAARCEERAACC
jgi:hypothetical protein